MDFTLWASSRTAMWFKGDQSHLSRAHGETVRGMLPALVNSLPFWAEPGGGPISKLDLKQKTPGSKKGQWAAWVTCQYRPIKMRPFQPIRMRLLCLYKQDLPGLGRGQCKYAFLLLCLCSWFLCAPWFLLSIEEPTFLTVVTFLYWQLQDQIQS